MAKKRMTKKQQKALFSLMGLVIALVFGLSTNQVEQVTDLLTGTSSSPSVGLWKSAARPLEEAPDQELANSVLTDQVVKQLGGDLAWNGVGAFVVKGNKTDLNADVASQPYVTNETKTVQGQTVPWRANALLTKRTRQYRDRHQTGQGGNSYRPPGWHQLHDLPGSYDHAVDRGHLIAYALAGSLKGFDASTSNPANIATQSAWSNQANSEGSTGQNYYEGLIRRALDKNKTVRYRVTLIYDGQNILASGSHLEAKSSDGSLEFNVFIPNVQEGLVFDYETGRVDPVP